MSEGHAHEHEHSHEHTAVDQPAPFRFEAFADAQSAKAAFEILYPVDSPAAPAVQALVDMGAHCSALGPAKIACRYVEEEAGLVRWCWHVAIEASNTNAIQRVAMGVAALSM